eukprot:c36769_g1_i1 orf=92-709(+)
MEAIHSVSGTSCLSQRVLLSGAASTSLCSSSNLCGELSLLPLRWVAPRRNAAVRACLQTEDVRGRPLSSSCRRRSSFNSLVPSTSAHHHSTRIQSAKKTYSSFDDLLNNTETALLVDFYATWCGPCQFMVPVLDDVGRALKDKLRVVKIDSEKYPAIASRYGVQALPTLLLFQNGRVIDRLEGAMSSPDLIKRIEGVLSSTTNAK